jgi:hypothetical protein
MDVPLNIGACLLCTMSAAPSTLLVLPANKVMAENKPAANIRDNKPIMNRPTFGVLNR